MHFDVLRVSVEDGFFRDLDAAEVVAEGHLGSDTSTRRSFSSRLSHMVSHVATTAPLYSVSMLHNATVGYFLLHEAIIALPKDNAYPDVDR